MTEIVETKRVVVPEWTRGWRLIRARGVIGISQAELAKAMGIPRQRVIDYEGDVREPTRGDLFAWADICGVSVEWLRTGETPSTGDTPDQHDVIPRRMWCSNADLRSVIQESSQVNAEPSQSMRNASRPPNRPSGPGRSRPVNKRHPSVSSSQLPLLGVARVSAS